MSGCFLPKISCRLSLLPDMGNQNARLLNIHGHSSTVYPTLARHPTSLALVRDTPIDTPKTSGLLLIDPDAYLTGANAPSLFQPQAVIASLPMLSVPTPRPYTPDITAAQSSPALDSPGQDASLPSDAKDSPPPNWPKAPIRHYTTLQEHADQILGTDASGQDGSITPRHTSRREGFSWGQKPQVGSHRHNQHAMTVELERPRSPPPLEEILKRTHIDDADDIQNNKVSRVNSMESHSLAALRLFGSLSTNASDDNPQDHRRSSIVAFAKGIAKHVPDLRILHSSDNKQEQERKDSKEDSVWKSQKTESQERFSSPDVTIDQLSRQVEKFAKPSNQQSPAASSGLRARRKVQLDLSMPSQIPDLPARGRYPVDMASNLAAPRPRSPKTPFMHSEQQKREADWIGRSSPIKEEDYASDDIAGLSHDNYGGNGLLPDNDTLYSSQSPKFEQPPVRLRDRCHITGAHSKRSRSRCSNQSAASASDLDVAQMPDGGIVPAEEMTSASTRAELQRVAQDSKISRARRRWRLRFTTSSEEAAPSSGAEPSKHRLSINPFKRSNRLSDQAAMETSRQNADLSHSADRNKQTRQSSFPLANMPTPPAFIPPGLNRIPTPPLYDANGEVKGKLADFLFDFQSNGVKGNRRRPQPSSEGYWDSDALLMSQSTDLTNFGDDEDEEEGPEGPLRNNIRSRSTFGSSSSPSKPFGQRHSGFQGIKPPLLPSLSTNSPMLGHDGWYRMNHEHDANLRDSGTVAELARQEEEERRKFEWLVPEHLPNSPLCPLHEKYTGPSQGLCYWHGRRSGTVIRGGEYARDEAWGGGGGGGGDYMAARSNNGEEDSAMAMGRSPGIVTSLAREVRRRRLVSLSSP